MIKQLLALSLILTLSLTANPQTNNETFDETFNKTLYRTVEGAVIVIGTLDTDGQFKNAKILAGKEIFHDTALKKASTFSSKPRMVNGKAVATPNAELTFNFKTKIPIETQEDVEQYIEEAKLSQDEDNIKEAFNLYAKFLQLNYKEDSLSLLAQKETFARKMIQSQAFKDKEIISYIDDIHHAYQQLSRDNPVELADYTLRLADLFLTRQNKAPTKGLRVFRKDIAEDYLDEGREILEKQFGRISNEVADYLIRATKVFWRGVYYSSKINRRLIKNAESIYKKTNHQEKLADINYMLAIRDYGNRNLADGNKHLEAAFKGYAENTDSEGYSKTVELLSFMHSNFTDETEKAEKYRSLFNALSLPPPNRHTILLGCSKKIIDIPELARGTYSFQLQVNDKGLVDSLDLIKGINSAGMAHLSPVYEHLKTCKFAPEFDDGKYMTSSYKITFDIQGYFNPIKDLRESQRKTEREIERNNKLHEILSGRRRIYR